MFVCFNNLNGLALSQWFISIFENVRKPKIFLAFSGIGERRQGAARPCRGFGCAHAVPASTSGRDLGQTFCAWRVVLKETRAVYCPYWPNLWVRAQVWKVLLLHSCILARWVLSTQFVKLPWTTHWAQDHQKSGAGTPEIHLASFSHMRTVFQKASQLEDGCVPKPLGKRIIDKTIEHLLVRLVQAVGET